MPKSRPLPTPPRGPSDAGSGLPPHSPAQPRPIDPQLAYAQRASAGSLLASRALVAAHLGFGVAACFSAVGLISAGLGGLGAVNFGLTLSLTGLGLAALHWGVLAGAVAGLVFAVRGVHQSSSVLLGALLAADGQQSSYDAACRHLAGFVRGPQTAASRTPDSSWQNAALIGAAWTLSSVALSTLHPVLARTFAQAGLWYYAQAILPAGVYAPRGTVEPVPHAAEGELPAVDEPPSVVEQLNRPVPLGP